MSFGEKMVASGYVAILGMGITFLALIILWGAIAVMSRVIAGFENKSKAALTVKAPVKETQKAVEPVQEAVNAADDAELVAVITAALSAMTEKPMSMLFVRNIRRLEEAGPAWQRAGIAKQVGKRM